MFEPNQHNVDRDLAASVKLFEQARVGPVTAFRPRQPRKLLLVVDGSSQDDAAVFCARRFREHFDCEVAVVDARERIESNNLAEETAAALETAALPKPDGDSFGQILNAIEQTACDLVVLACPYGRDFDAVGTDSTGTVIDVLLARSPVPLCVVRKPDRSHTELFGRELLLVTGESEAASAAAEWAAGLVSLGGEAELVLVLEEEYYEHLRGWIEMLAPDVDAGPESLAAALFKRHNRLHRRLQETAAEAGFRYRLWMERADDPRAHKLEADPEHPLLVLPLQRADHASREHVHDRLRHTPHLTLVVPAN